MLALSESPREVRAVPSRLERELHRLPHVELRLVLTVKESDGLALERRHF